MVSFERVIDTILAVKYVVERGLDGDFVECGPYRGGNSIAAKLKLENSNSNKQLFLYDTFTGMSVPNPNIDKSLLQNLNSLDIFIKSIIYRIPFNTFEISIIFKIIFLSRMKKGINIFIVMDHTTVRDMRCLGPGNYI